VLVPGEVCISDVRHLLAGASASALHLLLVYWHSSFYSRQLASRHRLTTKQPIITMMHA
jgi:hypothetical protein